MRILDQQWKRMNEHFIIFEKKLQQEVRCIKLDLGEVNAALTFPLDEIEDFNKGSSSTLEHKQTGRCIARGNRQSGGLWSTE